MQRQGLNSLCNEAVSICVRRLLISQALTLGHRLTHSNLTFTSLRAHFHEYLPCITHARGITDRRTMSLTATSSLPHSGLTSAITCLVITHARDFTARRMYISSTTRIRSS